MLKLLADPSIPSQNRINIGFNFDILHACLRRVMYINFDFRHDTVAITSSPDKLLLLTQTICTWVFREMSNNKVRSTLTSSLLVAQRLA